MQDLKSVTLQDEVEKVGDIEFIRAEWIRDTSPFVLIRYAIAGNEQLNGLALDLNKKIFLPDVKNEILWDDRIRACAPKVWEVVVRKRRLTPVVP
jgi:hypothetical protein